MIYLSKYQNNRASEPVGTKGSLSMSLEWNCGRIEEVFGKKNLLEKISSYFFTHGQEMWSSAGSPLFTTLLHKSSLPSGKGLRVLKKFWYVFLVLLIEGSSLMAAELLSARLPAPFYGNTLYVWMAFLCISVLALTLGYYSVGRFSAKNAIGKIIKTKGLLFSKTNLYPLTRGLKLGKDLCLASTSAQTRFNPLTLMSAKHKPKGKFLLPVMTIAFLLILLFSSSTVIGSGGTATYVVTFMPVASLAGDNPVMIGERKNCE